MSWDFNYQLLDEGDIILATDECQNDDASWSPDNGRCAGTAAPSPWYTSHRVYRRHIKATPYLDKNGDLIGSQLELQLREAWRRISKHHDVPMNGVLEADIVRSFLSMIGNHK